MLQSHRPFLPHFVFLLAIWVTVCFIYLLSLDGPFVFDDFSNLVSNSTLEISGSEFDAWRTAILGNDSGPLGRPVSMFSFALNVVVANGLSPCAVKSVNLVLHLAASGLLYVLLLQLRHAPALRVATAVNYQHLAMLVVVLWLFHPLFVSTVLYAVQRMAQLATLFVLFGLVVYCRYRNRWLERLPTVGEVAALFLWLLLILMMAAYSKENGALLPFFVLAVEVALYRGVFGGRDYPLVHRMAWFLGLLPVALMVVYLVTVPEFLEVHYAHRNFTPTERILTQLRLSWHYIGWLLLPDIRHMGIHHDDIALSVSWLSPLSTLFSAFGWVLIGIFAWFSRFRSPLLLFGALFFVVGHAIESTFLPLEMAYEHRNYLPGIGIVIVFAFGLLSFKQFVSSRLGNSVICVVLIFWGAMLFWRVIDWSTNDRLTLAAVENHPTSSRSHFFRGQHFINAHAEQLDEEANEELRAGLAVLAVKHFETASILDSGDAAASIMLYMLNKQFFEVSISLQHLQELLRHRVLQASDKAALVALAKCWSSKRCKEDPKEIENFFVQLRGLHGDDVSILRANYMYLLGSSDRYQERLLLLEELLSSAPGSMQAQYFRVQEYSRLGDVGGMYRSIASWLAGDTNRSSLYILSQLFDLEGE